MAEVKKTAKKVSVKKTTAKVAVKPAAKKVVKKAPAKVAAEKVAPKKAAVKVEAAPVATPKIETPKVEEVKVEVKAEEAKTEETKTEVRPVATKNPEFDLQEMLELGCHFGHKASKWHPKMDEYIYSEKDGIHLFDLPKVAGLLEEAYSYVYNLAKEGKTLVLVGTKKQAREVIKEAALDASCFYINARWMGGMLTNWPQVSKSIKRMEEIREGLATDRYKGYTKYERVQLEKEQIKLERFFGGLKGLKSKPDCIFVVDPKKERIVVAEANNVNVPVIALIDSDSDPRPVQFVLPGNDDAVKSIKFFVDQITAAYKAGRADRK
ncbi:MAG: 30S ribosomal protein S2 [Candidatus Pacebacteria bacterium GW2011_GWF2_38_9]|nr:MAG: 30S ribosomal protein S2, small subunit ribosomal protein S2 [candidate division TM6 bacterium GW2011_GWF2_28_16]KKQ89102.1 MAG: 30S ribosomal protein S2 [Candidatus Pacebacteria bacterium GW2011_GWF2_38_9]HAZ73602.1 30S ribosomal protein S2 [Candidatus Paceibacterota bacterium]